MKNRSNQPYKRQWKSLYHFRRFISSVGYNSRGLRPQVCLGSRVRWLELKNISKRTQTNANFLESKQGSSQYNLMKHSCVPAFNPRSHNYRRRHVRCVKRGHIDTRHRVLPVLRRIIRSTSEWSFVVQNWHSFLQTPRRTDGTCSDFFGEWYPVRILTWSGWTKSGYDS